MFSLKSSVCLKFYRIYTIVFYDLTVNLILFIYYYGIYSYFELAYIFSFQFLFYF